MQSEAQSEKLNKQETLVSANQKNHPRETVIMTQLTETANPGVLQGLR